MRPLWGLAMTDVVDGLRPGFDFPLSLRGPTGPWQSVTLQAVIFRNAPPSPLNLSRAHACNCAAGQKCLHGVRIATSLRSLQ